MTEWERNREQMEFDRAAILYHNSDNNSGNKPTSNSFMSSRFVSAKGNEELDVGKDLSKLKGAQARRKIYTSYTRSHPEVIIA